LRADGATREAVSIIYFIVPSRAYITIGSTIL
jgi:hypothetical protein